MPALQEPLPAVAAKFFAEQQCCVVGSYGRGVEGLPATSETASCHPCILRVVRKNLPSDLPRPPQLRRAIRCRLVLAFCRQRHLNRCSSNRFLTSLRVPPASLAAAAAKSQSHQVQRQKSQKTTARPIPAGGSDRCPESRGKLTTNRNRATTGPCSP